MTLRLPSRLGLLCAATLLVQAPPSLAQSIAEEVPVLAKALAKQLVERKTVKVAAVDFTDLQGRPNELGRFLADQVSVELVMADGITVIDRANLNAIMAEHKLTAEGLVNPENARKLGQFAGVDAVLVGSLTAMDGAVQLTVRAISTNTSALVAAGRMRLALTDDIGRMLGLSVSAGGGASRGALASAPAAAAPTTPVAAPVSVGPLVVTVKGVTYATVAGLPQIRVVLEFENRNLHAAVAVATNSQVVTVGRDQPKGCCAAPTLAGISGGLTDSEGARWSAGPGSFRGMSSVYGFETVEWPFLERDREPHAITQNAPSNIVGYIQTAERYDGRRLSNVTQRYWSGDFSMIEPGGEIEVTAVFTTQPAARGGGRAPSSAASPPAFFDLSLELVTANVKDGERPDRASDLSLRSLSVNRLTIPR